ncbi:MAG: STAS domain-containing protein [Rhodocyclaceae bacterium]|nr:STAS domain-containing protein [Rhodocyclaceae bacterium]MDZ4214949.1 STAS domain-containing protein [Rhodocyclaceae bacterium]
MQIPVQHNDGKARIGLPHNFDTLAMPHFREAYNGAFDSTDITEIEIDFGNVHYIDSSALGGLLLLRQRAEAAALTITIIRCQPEVMKVLAMANFHRIFNIH